MFIGAAIGLRVGLEGLLASGFVGSRLVGTLRSKLTGKAKPYKEQLKTLEMRTNKWQKKVIEIEEQLSDL